MNSEAQAMMAVIGIAAFVILVPGAMIYAVGFRRGREAGRAAGVQEGRDLQRVDDIQEQWRKESARHGKDGKFIAIRGKEKA